MVTATSGSSGLPRGSGGHRQLRPSPTARRTDIEAALATLPPRDAKVLRLYFGLDDGNSRTLEEIGRMMGVTRERIRQLRDRALTPSPRRRAGSDG